MAFPKHQELFALVFGIFIPPSTALDLPSAPSLCLQLGLSRAAPWEGLSSPLGCQWPWHWQDTGILAG